MMTRDEEPFISNDGKQVGFFCHDKHQQMSHWVICPSKDDTVQITSLVDRKNLGFANERFNLGGGEFKLAKCDNGNPFTWSLVCAASGKYLKKSADGLGATETAVMEDFLILPYKDKKDKPEREKREKRDRKHKAELHESLPTPQHDAKAEPKREAPQVDLNQKAKVDCWR